MHMTVGELLAWVGLVLQLAMIVLATWLYFARRSLPYALLLAACVAYVISHSAWFTFNFAAGFFQARPTALHTIRSCAAITAQSFNILFPILLILTLVSLYRETKSAAG
jgi:hypothetical protein